MYSIIAMLGFESRNAQLLMFSFYRESSLEVAMLLF